MAIGLGSRYKLHIRGRLTAGQLGVMSNEFGASQSLRHSIPNFRSGSTAAPAGLSGERLQGLQHRTSRRRMVDEDWNLENQTFCSCSRQTQNDPMIYGYARGSTESQSVEAQVRQLRPPVPRKVSRLVLLVSPSLRVERHLWEQPSRLPRKDRSRSARKC